MPSVIFDCSLVDNYLFRQNKLNLLFNPLLPSVGKQKIGKRSNLLTQNNNKS